MLQNAMKSMAKSKLAALGIDTSNYKTSVALVDTEGSIICNEQQFLEVKKGERGLRQSTALFQHVNNLPTLIERAFDTMPKDMEVGCIGVSTRPRPVEGSYMPVFNAGFSAARMLSASLGVPCFQVSHQEGHIEAVKHDSIFRDTQRLICFHFSGGTSEALLVDNGKIDIVGGSKDLAFGQVLDRLGVALGMDFPCGQEMDEIACGYGKVKGNILPKIKCTDGYINLSGIETKCQRSVSEIEPDALITMTFHRLADAIGAMCSQLKETYQISDFLFAGGVSSSRYIRQYLTEHLTDCNVCFGDPALSTDNAVGVARLGGKRLWL